MYLFVMQNACMLEDNLVQNVMKLKSEKIIVLHLLSCNPINSLL
jgi:hypothetical protein